MILEFDPQNAGKQKVQTLNTETYMAFRSAIPKPVTEDKHLRHILRFYLTRAMLKQGEEDIYILPKIKVGDHEFVADVLAVSDEKYTMAICEPNSITPETEEMLDVLKDVDNLNVIVVHSRYGNPGNVLERFKEQLENKKFRVLAVVPPPFDDVYEYDIWMFETTFRDLFNRE